MYEFKTLNRSTHDCNALSPVMSFVFQPPVRGHLCLVSTMSVYGRFDCVFFADKVDDRSFDFPFHCYFIIFSAGIMVTNMSVERQQSMLMVRDDVSQFLIDYRCKRKI